MTIINWIPNPNRPASPLTAGGRCTWPSGSHAPLNGIGLCTRCGAIPVYEEPAPCIRCGAEGGNRTRAGLCTVCEEAEVDADPDMIEFLGLSDAYGLDLDITDPAYIELRDFHRAARG